MSAVQDNETAHTLTREGSNSPLLVWVVGLISRQRSDAFNTYYSSLPYARQTRNCISINARNATHILWLSRQKMRRVSRVLTGHYGLNTHHKTVCLLNSPTCAQYIEGVSAEHFFFSNPPYITSRALHLGAFFLRYNSFHSLHPKDVMSLSN